MATTAYPVNHPLARKLWAKQLAYEAISEAYFGRFVGTSKNSLCQLKTETEKEAGDRIRIGLRVKLAGSGVSGDGTLEGNEESLTTYYDDVLIDQLRHAVRSDGKMSEQRVPFSVREEARDSLKDWWTERLDTAFLNQLAGNTAQADVRYTGMQATIAPTSTRLIAANGHDTEASLSDTTTHSLKLSDIDRAVAKAKTVSPLIRPIKIDGQEKYVLFIHENDMYQLRASNTSTVGNYVDLFKAAMSGGVYKDNPIVKGASFEYNNVIVHASNRIPNVPSSTTRRRCVLAGAQAMALAVGQGGSPEGMSWEEELFDYGNQLGVAAGKIFGLKKTVYNSTDFGTIVISTYAPNL